MKRKTRRDRANTPQRETELYAPIRDFLDGNGYTVRAEVHGCDIAAEKDGELIIIEMKRHFGIDLLYQATDRQRRTDSVYVAIPVPDDMGRNPRWRAIKRLLRQLELGLIVVFFGGPAPRVELVFHPLPYQRQKRSGARRAILREMAGRSNDLNVGGSAQRKLVTAYRENALQIACCLEALGPTSPGRLRALGTGPKTTAILYGNVYGWFDRVDRGVYSLTAQGVAALEVYPEIVARYREVLSNSVAELGRG